MTKRIIQLLMQTAQWTRSQVRLLLKEGRVQVDGKTVLGEHYFVKEGSLITVNGEKIKLPEENIYFMLNKPAGYSCQKGTHPNVLSFFKNIPVFAIGRLDKDTEGLLLLTNDGDYAHRILSPDHKTEKEYFVTTLNALDTYQLTKLAEGVSIKLGTTRYLTKPALVTQQDNHSLFIVIKEGKKRQIRKMLKGVGNKVVTLTRIRIGKLALGDLKLGTTKQLTKEEAFLALTPEQ